MRYWLTHLLLIEGRVNGSAGLERAEHIQQPASSALSSDAIKPNKNLNDLVVNNDRLMSMAGVDYRYDASGNQISQIGCGDKQQRSFNGLNQLVQINVNGKLTQYEYDALGRRSAKITELGRTDFIWDNHQLIGECTSGEYSWYIYQPDTFTPVALIKAGQVYYYHLDQIGTPICLTDDNAQIVWRSQQDVFGQTIESTSIKDRDIENADYAGLQDKITNPIRFQGQYFDDESGLHYNRFRYYSPGQARFIHQDPIGLVGGINHYQYAPNPVNWVDPFGLLCKEGQARVKAALDANPTIPDDLKEKILVIARLDNTSYTADELIEHIENGTPIGIGIVDSELNHQGIPISYLDEVAMATNRTRNDIENLYDILEHKTGVDYKTHIENYVGRNGYGINLKDAYLIMGYTTNFFMKGRLAPKMLAGVTLNKAETTLVNSLNNALDKLPSESGTFYRGLGKAPLPSWFDDKYHIGAIINETFFASVSEELSPEYEGGKVMVFKSNNVKNLSPLAMDVHFADKIGQSPAKSEHLIQSGHRVVVKSNRDGIVTLVHLEGIV
ncbi:RHS domain-containing protein [Shewanella sp. SR44-4]|uniref:RHS repeat domain-containing protein n=1 Tax=Shewanella sp. SR44-4 TaxID=2760935 RepID=UPI001602BD70|nr:RHS repeat-associated core domain-containing protein [Shewanella sp. SR44-4]MBB1364716.1 RHS domain-containing protein [Shewanella sp. SR44-4]